jgi:hypothetical protein
MGQRSAMYTHHDVSRRQALLAVAERFANPALQGIAPYRQAHLALGNDQTQPRPTLPQNGLELARRQQPLPAAETVAARGRSGQRQTLLMRWRPLARRALRTLRPPTVRMRARKPCVRARRRLLG